MRMHSQSMNFIGAFLLLHYADEATAFVMLVRTLQMVRRPPHSRYVIPRSDRTCRTQPCVGAWCTCAAAVQPARLLHEGPA